MFAFGLYNLHVYKDNWKMALYQLIQTKKSLSSLDVLFKGVCVVSLQFWVFWFKFKSGLKISFFSKFRIFNTSQSFIIISKLSIDRKQWPSKTSNIEFIDHAFPPNRSGKPLTVIWSGPCGLSATLQLNKVGHLDTIVKQNNAIVGLLRYGLPSMKLGYDLVQPREGIMANEGID